jgi:hypothetical protein
MASLVKRKIAEAERKQRTVERQVSVEKARIAVEIAQCNFRMAITPSKAVIKRNSEKLAEFNAEMSRLDSVVASAKAEKTRVVRSFAAYL